MTAQELEEQIAAASTLNERGNYSEALLEWHRLLAYAEEHLLSEYQILVSRLFNGLAVSYEAIGRYSEAESFYIKALEIQEKESGPEHADMANSLNNLAGLYGIVGRFEDSEKLYLRALNIFQNTSALQGLDTADILYNLAGICHSSGRFSEAETYYNRSLHIRMKLLPLGHQDIACSLNGLAVVYEATGKLSAAENAYLEALSIFTEALGLEHHFTADCFQNLASIYESTGRFAKALEYFTKSLEIRRSVLGEKHPDFANSLVGMASVLDKTGQFNKAEEHLQLALKTIQLVFGDDHHHIAYCLNSLAKIYLATNRYDEAIDSFSRAAYLSENTFGPDHPDVAYCLCGLAETALYKKNVGEAIAQSKKSLSIYCRLLPFEHPDVTKNLYNFSLSYAVLNLTNLAIFWGKHAVNAAQKLRENVHQAGVATLSSFDGTICRYYEHLASLLIEAGRFGEAAFVMGMLKEKEQFELLRGNFKRSISSHTIAYNNTEQHYACKFSEFTDQLAVLGKLENALAHEKNRTDQQNEELRLIRSEIYKLNNEFSIFLDNLQETMPSNQVSQLDQDSYKLIDMTDATRDTAAIISVSAENEFHTILITSHGRKAFTLPVKSKELASKVLTLITLLKDPEDQLYLPLAKELYDVILRPIERELLAGDFTTILWMLNGVLRLLPIAALHDGNRFAVEKFSNVCITTMSKIGRSPQCERWNGLGMGTTRAYAGHNPLPAVKDELEGIISSRNSSSGVMPGEILLDDDFTRESMVSGLEEGFKAVHIASHFELNPANETMSYLLLGDGNKIRMDELRSMPRLFKGVDLVAFSACSTGLGTASTKGREVDGIGYLGEMQGAKSVLATLWPVEDKSTSMLMREFYRLKESGLSKAEALQKAQLKLVYGEMTSPDNHDFTHPYFWAPFILIGGDM